jgi:hypothetical protein
MDRRRHHPPRAATTEGKFLAAGARTQVELYLMDLFRIRDLVADLRIFEEPFRNV